MMGWRNEILLATRYYLSVAVLEVKVKSARSLQGFCTLNLQDRVWHTLNKILVVLTQRTSFWSTNQNSCHALIMLLQSCRHSNSRTNAMASAYIPRLGLSVPEAFLRSAAKELGYQQPTVRAGGSSHEVCRWKGCLYFFAYREYEECLFC